MSQTNNNVEIDVALLKREVVQISDLFSKLDSAIDKLGEAASHISRMLAVHDEKLVIHERVDREIFELVEKRRLEMQEDIKELHSRITTNQRELAGDIAETEKRIIDALKELKTDIESNRKITINDSNKLEDRISALETWRWILVGAGTVVGFLISKFETFFKLFN